jgi:hypothetical protein
MSDTSPIIGENEKLSSTLNEILSNPQMLSAISSIAQGLKNGNSAQALEKKDIPSESGRENENTQKNESDASIQSKLPELLNMLSTGSNNAKQSQRSELLFALKPYLSQSRSEAIDKIIRFSELSSVFKSLS